MLAVLPLLQSRAHHSGSRLTLPRAVRFGEATRLQVWRKRALAAACAAHPVHFVHGAPTDYATDGPLDQQARGDCSTISSSHRLSAVSDTGRHRTVHDSSFVSMCSGSRSARAISAPSPWKTSTRSRSSCHPRSGLRRCGTSINPLSPHLMAHVRAPFSNVLQLRTPAGSRTTGLGKSGGEGVGTTGLPRARRRSSTAAILDGVASDSARVSTGSTSRKYPALVTAIVGKISFCLK